MNSLVDYIECPVCGGSAFREQHSNGDIEMHCTECGFSWSNDEPKDWDNNNTVKDVRDPNKVYIVWQADDVEALKPEWSKERCQRALSLCSKVLTGRSIEEGWIILGDLLSINSEEIEAIDD